MSVRAGVLLGIMSLRLEMQEDGITNPSSHIKEVTKTLVEKLSKIDANEKINIKILNDEHSQYIRIKNGEILAEINE